MIRVYFANFTKQDFEDIASVLSIGLEHVCPIDKCVNQQCSSCEKRRVCRAVANAVVNLERRKGRDK